MGPSAKARPPAAADLLQEINSHFLQDRLAACPAYQQAAVRQCLGRTLVSVAKGAGKGKAQQITADFIACVFFLSLQRWGTKPDKQLVQDVTSRLERSKAWQPKDIPHWVWAIHKYGTLKRTKGARADYGRSAQQVHADLVKHFEQQKCQRVCFATDGDELHGEILHWEHEPGTQPEQPSSFLSVRTVPYQIGSHRCVLHSYVLPQQLHAPTLLLCMALMPKGLYDLQLSRAMFGCLPHHRSCQQWSACHLHLLLQSGPLCSLRIRHSMQWCRFSSVLPPGSRRISAT